MAQKKKQDEKEGYVLFSSWDKGYLHILHLVGRGGYTDY
jgi:hypothetical protein